MPAPLADVATGDRPATAATPLWRRILPFVLATALVALVLMRLDIGLLVRQLGRANYPGLILFATAITFSLLLADTFATVGIYRRTVCPISFRELFVLRAASYLPSLLNHHVGQAWLTYFLSKVYRAPLWRVAGATLLTYATTLGCLLLFGVLAVPFNSERIPWLVPLLAASTALAFLYLGAIAAKPRFMQAWQATAPLVEVGVKGHLIAFVYRIPHMVVLFAGSWLVFWFFGIRIPLGHALATVPLLMLVAALPITPQGMGTRDLLSVELFSRYAAGTPQAQSAAIVAATLSWACALTVVQLIISSIFMRKARRLLGAPS
ncbi:MAG TPA: lysylphosphatidylglycerol synthase domain-containing protein [Polyangiaceae bacterium]|nr:lysylphosphatidylglycerol synthase domain-containing protein [Polyangiaceae bacterium]